MNGGVRGCPQRSPVNRLVDESVARLFRPYHRKFSALDSHRKIQKLKKTYLEKLVKIERLVKDEKPADGILHSVHKYTYHSFQALRVHKRQNSARRRHVFIRPN